MNKSNKFDNIAQKPLAIWSNSQFNKKTYETLFYKKTFDKNEPIRDKLINNKSNKNVKEMT